MSCLFFWGYLFGNEKYGTILREPFLVNRCKNCSCVYVVDPIHPKHLDEIYDKKYFSGEGLDDSVDYVENLKRQSFFFEKYDYQIGSELKQYNLKSGLKWLDLGCAVGNVLDWAEDRYSAKTYGIELSQFASDIAKSRGHKLIGATVEDITKKYRGYFDVITCYEVLEHLYEPNKIIESVSYMLKEGGVFHYSTGAPPKDHQISDWDYLRPEVHITFYSPECIGDIFIRNNLTPFHRKKLQTNIKLKYFKLSWKQKIKKYFPEVVIELLRKLRVLHRLQPDAIKGNRLS